ncbi:MAG TPA: hypothetical protein VK642_13065 [Burkholderiales bacterium]|nr:hypothetical protein [Burkholderiales bacterium]
MKKVIGTLAVAAALVMATSAMADGPHGYNRFTVQPVYTQQHSLAGLREVNLRQEEQRARIERGLHRGTITRWEFRRLMAEQHDIQAMERAFVADGFLNPRERMELNRRLDITSANIMFEARDHQRRF